MYVSLSSDSSIAIFCSLLEAFFSSLRRPRIIFFLRMLASTICSYMMMTMKKLLLATSTQKEAPRVI